MKRIAVLLAVLSAAAWGQAVRLEGGGDVRPQFSNAKVEARSASGGLEAALRGLGALSKGAAWAGYAVASQPGRRYICCFDSVRGADRSNGCCGGCKLESDHGTNITTNREGCPQSGESDHVFVMLRLEGGAVQKARVFTQDCALDAGGLSVYWLTGVTTEQSLALLQQLAQNGFAGGRRGLGDDAMLAIAMHAGDGADRALEKLAAEGNPLKQRTQAAFWMGEERGKRGVEILKAIVARDKDAKFREESTFAFSQSEAPEGLDQLIFMARQDPSTQVRGQALFWLAQKAGHKAASTITDAMENDPETEVRKKAVFALSQMPPEEGVPLLLKYAKSHKDPVVRKEAIFWLGQSGDPRALDFMEEVLLGKKVQ